MEEIDLEETVWRRGWLDFKGASKTFWFWVPEAGGTALIGIWDAALAAFFFFAFAFGVWVGVTARAPLRQRNETRLEVRSLRQSMSLPISPGWVSTESALQYMYDELSSGRFNDQGQMLQAFKTIGDKSDDLWDHVGGWLVDGIQRGFIEATGRKERRSSLDPIPPSIDGGGGFDPLPNRYVKDEDGMCWEVVEVRKSSLDRYLLDLEDD